MNDQKSTSLRLWVIHMFGVAIVYGVLGNLSLLLAIPPGYATAIWPPSGVALAAVLVYGYRVWPGVLVGSFLVNFPTGLDTSSALTILGHLPVPIGIAIGAALQSVTGAYCLRRFAGFPNQLATARETFLFLFWGGAVGSIVNAAVGASVLWGAGIITAPNLFINFGTWWFGDAIGVFVFAPLILVWASSPKEAWAPRRLTVTVFILIALALTVTAVSDGSRWERHRIKQEFDRQISPLAPALAKALNSYIEVLYSLEGFYAASSTISRDEFKTFIKRPLTSFTGIQALSWNPRIGKGERRTFERRTQQEGFAHFHITERNAEGQIVAANERPEYISVHFIEPLSENLKAFGFDVASNPARLKAMEQARDLAQPIATGRITLVQETGNQFGVLVFMPVYRNKLPHDTVADRRLNLAGYMVGVFRGGDIVKAALQGIDLEGINYRIIDESAPAQEKLLMENHPPESAVKTLVEKGLFGGSILIGRTFPIEFGGRQWILEASPSQEYITHRRQENAWLIMVGGMLLTGLIGSFVLVVSGRSVLLRKLVDERTSKLEQSEKHIRAIVDNALDGIITINDLGIMQSANPAAQTIFGYSHEDLIGQNISMLTPEPHRSAHDGYISSYLKSGEAKLIGMIREVEGERKDGARVTLELQVSQFTVGSNHLFLGIVRDISERKQAEKTLANVNLDLQRANDLAQQYLDVSPALYVSLDDKGTITTINQKGCELLGYEEHELLNKNWFEMMVPQNNQRRVLSAFKKIMSGDIKPVKYLENKLVVKSGEERLFSFNNVPIYKTSSNEDDLSITGVLFVAEDITDRRISEAALRQSQKMEAVGQLTGGIAHDFNNMLAIIMGNLELLRRKVKDDPNVIKHVDAAYAGGERGAKITKKLLSFSRHPSEDQTLVNVNELIGGMTDLIGKSLTPKIILETHLADDVRAVNINPDDFDDTLLNLAINAGDAMPGGGTLLIEAMNKTLDEQYVQLNPGCAVGDYVLISISDTGVGMAPDVVEQAFQPFFTTKEIGKGTGLGLSMVYGFVHRSKGNVKIYSEPGRGTTVRLYLPCADQNSVDAEQITSNGVTDLVGGKETILVVDDEQGLADVAVAYLEDLGYTTLVANSGQQALEVLQEHPEINLMFSDVVMPGEVDGYDLAKETMHLYPTVKVLLTSGFTAKREGAISGDIPLFKKLTNDLLNKPYNQTELAQAVRNILDKED